jgi:hypothetical protein
MQGFSSYDGAINVPNGGAVEISADSSAAAAVFIEKAAVQVSALNTPILLLHLRLRLGD